jgi:PEP-CTERM motif-containing protein
MNKLGLLIAAGMLALLPACGGSGGSGDGSGENPRGPHDPGDTLVHDIPRLPKPGGKTSPPTPPPPSGTHTNVPSNTFHPSNGGGPVAGAPPTSVPGHVGPRAGGPNTPPPPGGHTQPGHRVPTGTVIPPSGAPGTGREVPRTLHPGGDDTPTPGGPTPPVHGFPNDPVGGGFQVPPSPHHELPHFPSGGDDKEPRVPSPVPGGTYTNLPSHPAAPGGDGGHGTEPVPEPSTWVLFGLGTIFCALLARTRTSAARTIAVVDGRR